MLTPGPIAIGNATFEPGCRNNWHSYAGGQILLVTAGEGYYQAEGEPAQRLKTVNVVNIPAGDSWFVHLAATSNPDKPETQWFESVNEEQYTEANKVR